MCQKHSEKQILKINWTGFLVLTLAVFFSGGNPTPAMAQSRTDLATNTCTPRQLRQMSNDIKEKLATTILASDFSFEVTTDDGRQILYSRGNSDMNTVYESASTSKWVSGAIILSLVDQGYLSLDSKPQDFLPKAIWPIEPTDPLYNIRLRDLLSFTSGLTEEPKCMNHPGADYAACVRDIALINAKNGKVPATEFWYSGSHLQVAGLMAIKARGAKSWQDLYKEFQTRTKLFPTATYDLPSASNPRLAGGMHWNGNEYMDFVQAYYNHKILSKELQAIAMSDQLVGKSIPPEGNPAAKRHRDWHYGFALWLECDSKVFDCTEVESFSSPGAYGAYPFMDVKYKFQGIIAREEKPGIVPGYDIYDLVKPQVIKWAAKDCSATKE